MNLIIKIVTFLVVTGSVFAQPYINTNGWVVAGRLPNPLTVDGGVAPNPPWSLYKQHGWRHYAPCPYISGSNSVTPVALSDDGNTVFAAACDYTEQIISSPVPDVFLHGIVIQNGLIFLPATPGGTNGYAVAVDTDGSLTTAHWYGSPTSSVEEITAEIAAKQAKRNEGRSAIAAATNDFGKGQLPDRVATLEQALSELLKVTGTDSAESGPRVKKQTSKQ